MNNVPFQLLTHERETGTPKCGVVMQMPFLGNSTDSPVNDTKITPDLASLSWLLQSSFALQHHCRAQCYLVSTGINFHLLVSTTFWLIFLMFCRGSEVKGCHKIISEAILLCQKPLIKSLVTTAMGGIDHHLGEYSSVGILIPQLRRR